MTHLELGKTLAQLFSVYNLQWGHTRDPVKGIVEYWCRCNTCGMKAYLHEYYEAALKNGIDTIEKILAPRPLDEVVWFGVRHIPCHIKNRKDQ